MLSLNRDFVAAGLFDAEYGIARAYKLLVAMDKKGQYLTEDQINDLLVIRQLYPPMIIGWLWELLNTEMKVFKDI